MENILSVEYPQQVEEEEDNELEVGLISRRKNVNQMSLSTTNNNIVEQEHEQEQEQEQEQVQEQEQEEKEVKEFNSKKVDEDNNKQEEYYSVYYDKDNGNGLHTESSVEDVNGADLDEEKTVPENTDITIDNQEKENGVNSVISSQNGEHQKHDNFPEISFREVDKSSSSQINNATEITEIEVIKDSEDVITEFDVETVLKKQDTHELFCPNCNSCITKRVILRKRKRLIPVPGEDAKRNKPEALNPTEVNGVLHGSSDNQEQNGVDHSLEDVQPPPLNEYDPQREPDVFRCLSCFSIFMPTGNGFKLFRIFGNKSNNENSERKEVPVKKQHWFSNFFGSDKMEDNVGDRNDSRAVQNLNSENNQLDILEQRVGKESEKVTKDSTGRIIVDSSLADTNEQLLTSYHTENNGESEYPGMFVVKPPSNHVEAAENSISPLQHDGLKLVIPPNVGSLIIDNSQMNQELDVTVQMNTPGLDEKGKTSLSFSPPVSMPGQSNLGYQINDQGFWTNLGVNGKEQKTGKDIIVPEVSQQHTVQNDVEIRLEEPQKVEKDVLTDKQVQLLEDLKNIERIHGKDTIITIETKRPDDSASTPYTLGATGTPALQNVVSGSQVVGQRGTTTETGSRSLDIVKSIVYGGLMESITSLSVVSSAVGADAATMNVLGLGLANIFGGLFIICHDLWDLKNERTRKSEDRYQKLLGQRKADFPLHMVVSLLSYLVFGFLPPVVYGFSFRESNDKNFKLLMVAAASIVSIMTLAAGKAYVQSPRKSYFTTIAYYVMLGFMVSGASYLFGELIMMLLEKIDIFDSRSVVNLSNHGASSNPPLATY